MRTNRILRWLFFPVGRNTLLACLALLPVRPALTASELTFAHFADGGGYRTTLLLTNPTALATTARVGFRDSAGGPILVTAGGRTGSEFAVALPARGSARLETSGSPSSPRVGWVRVTSSPETSIRGNCVFQLYSGAALFCEASVPSAVQSASMDLFVDEDAGFHTGFALANAGTGRAEGTLTLRRGDGSEAGAWPFSLDPGHHTATFLFQVFTSPSSGRAEIRLREGTLAAAALRYHASSVFSTVAVGSETAAVDALFSPGGGIRNRILRHIREAAASIDIAIYSFTSDEIRDALIAARGRGVAVRIVADAGQVATQGGEIPTLEQAGFRVKRMSGAGTGIMHNKYMIVDGSTVATGSYNWSYSAENYNYENVVIIEGSVLVQPFLDDFIGLWAR